jgi:hypothetical protein
MMDNLLNIKDDRERRQRVDERLWMIYDGGG